MDGTSLRKRGFLTKRGDFRHSWRVRYFVVSSDGRVRYFSDQSGWDSNKSPKGEFQCIPCEVIEAGHKDLPLSACEGRNFVFAVRPSKSSRMYILSADSTEEMTAWITVFRELTLQSVAWTAPMPSDTSRCHFPNCVVTFHLLRKAIKCSDCGLFFCITHAVPASDPSVASSIQTRSGICSTCMEKQHSAEEKRKQLLLQAFIANEEALYKLEKHDEQEDKKRADSDARPRINLYANQNAPQRNTRAPTVSIDDNLLRDRDSERSPVFSSPPSSSSSSHPSSIHMKRRPPAANAAYESEYYAVPRWCNSSLLAPSKEFEKEKDAYQQLPADHSADGSIPPDGEEKKGCCGGCVIC